LFTSYPQDVGPYPQLNATSGGRVRHPPGVAKLRTNGRPVGGALMTSQRLTVQEAAEVLGTSVDAVRMRVRRGSLQSKKDPDGRVYVWVDEDSSETKPGLDGEPSMLISAKDETIHILTQQLEAERRANEENRRIIAALTSRIPAIEAPPDEREATEMASGEPERAAPQFDARDRQEGAQRRSWWRRMFGS
jgi:excisionase family DNA binding protein